MAMTAEEKAEIVKAVAAAVGEKSITKDQLAPMMYTIAESLKNMQTQVSNQERRMAAPAVQNPEPEPEPKVTQEDLDKMSRADLVRHTIEQVKAQQTKPLAEVVAKTTADTKKADMMRQAQAANDAHPDFQEYYTEMKAILDNNPALNIEQVYQLARLEDPVKRDRIDAELQKKEDATKKEEEDKEGANVIEMFGGLTPTSGITTEREGDVPMTTQEAVEDAWEKTGMDEALAALES